MPVSDIYINILLTISKEYSAERIIEYVISFINLYVCFFADCAYGLFFIE